MSRRNALSTIAMLAALAAPVTAQDSATPAAAEPAATAQVTADDALLTEAQLEELVAPVALYPDTLLVQVLVAATYPLQIVKASRLVTEGAEMSEEERKAAIEAEGFDPSVEVLAVAFPDVLTRMSDNIDWTETVGDTMLAQSDDVMNAVQVLRQQAIETGALIDTPEQEVTVEETLSTKGEPSETVIIQPADPEVVYVPQYDTNAVYNTGRYTSSSDLWTAGLIGFASYAVIDSIFSRNDDWYNYWGCRNCGGWNGTPIVRDPSIDIDVDGNVNIGNDISIDRDKIKGSIDKGDINIGDRNNGDRNIGDRDRPDRPNGWQPDVDRQKEARENLASKYGGDGGRSLPAPAEDRGNDLREKLSSQTGSQDISRPGNSDALRDAAVAAGAAGGAVAGREALKRSSDRRDVPVNRPNVSQKPGERPKADRAAARPEARKPAAKPAAKPKVNRPANGGKAVAKPAAKKVAKPAAKKSVNRSASGHSKPKIKKQSGGKRAKAASKRGHASKPRHRR